MFFEQTGSSLPSWRIRSLIAIRFHGVSNSCLVPKCELTGDHFVCTSCCFVWVALDKVKMNPSIPRKFGLGLIFNGLAFGLLMFALSSLVDANSKIPFWPFFMVYVIQSIGELCLSPIGLSMVTKLAPTRLVGLGMGGWFLSTGMGNNLSGILPATPKW